MPVYATATAAAFADFWFSLPRAGKMPSLATFLDRPMPQLQPKVAVTEIISDSEILYRLLGTELVDGFGQERTGHNILDVAEPKLRPDMVAFFRAVIETPCGARALVEAATNHERDIVFETVCFPLARERAQPVIVGCNDTLDPLSFDENVIRFKGMRAVDWITL